MESCPVCRKNPSVCCQHACRYSNYFFSSYSVTIVVLGKVLHVVPLDENESLGWIRQYKHVAWTGLEFSDLYSKPRFNQTNCFKSLGLLHNHLHLYVHVFEWHFLVTLIWKWCFSCQVFVTFVSVLCRTKWWKWSKCRCFSEYYMKSCSFAIWAVDISHLKTC